MGGAQWLLELVLVGLLAATLFHALRLERALGVLKRDRAALEALVNSFNASTRQAEDGIERLRSAADGAGRHIAKQAEIAASLKDDLIFLIDRGERLADRMDTLVRAARPLAADPAQRLATPPSFAQPSFTAPSPQPAPQPAPPAVAANTADPELPNLPRVRSQAERDLLKALRMAR